jgi:alkylation response protein AidB-like acyl-CoA dehydrogenase
MEGRATVTADLLYSDSERALTDALGSLLADRCGWDKVLARTESAETCDAELWHAVAADLGLAGLLIPERAGGAGASYREAASAAEALGAAVASVPFLGSAVVATACLLACGGSAGVRSAKAESAEVEHLLGRLADGGLTAALAVPFATGPGAPQLGSAGPLPVRVAGPHPGDDKAGWSRLRGSVSGVADALIAGTLLVPADGVPRGLYAVDMSTARVTRTPVVSLDMTRQLCDVSFDDAPAVLIASGNAAAAAVSAAVRAGACVLAAEQLGVAQRCLDMTVAYVKERRQFARPVGSFQAIKHRLADVFVAVAQARAASRYAADCLATSDPDAPVAVSLAKAYCSEVAVHAAQECVQLHGGIGFTWEHPAHLYLKRAKADSIGFGSADAHRTALADRVNLPSPA